jgi:hypothetical protein
VTLEKMRVALVLSSGLALRRGKYISAELERRGRKEETHKIDWRTCHAGVTPEPPVRKATDSYWLGTQGCLGMGPERKTRREPRQHHSHRVFTVEFRCTCQRRERREEHVDAPLKAILSPSLRPKRYSVKRPPL